MDEKTIQKAISLILSIKIDKDYWETNARRINDYLFSPSPEESSQQESSCTSQEQSQDLSIDQQDFLLENQSETSISPEQPSLWNLLRLILRDPTF